MLPSSRVTPRFQRSRLAGTPRRVLEKNSNEASSNALGRKAALSDAMWKVRYFFQAAIGCESTSLAPAVTEVSPYATTLVTAGMPASFANCSRSKLGASFLKSATDMPLKALSGTRSASCVQWPLAISVSNLITVSAEAAGAGSPRSSNIFVT